MCDEEGEESCHDIHTCSGTCSVWEGGGGSMAEAREDSNLSSRFRRYSSRRLALLFCCGEGILTTTSKKVFLPLDAVVVCMLPQSLDVVMSLWLRVHL